ncbi:MAG: NAD-dependent epimerase/dehydratase family protein [Actinomycetia bacterium]|nr:NAD-dependent epimerase/dehydratase family protein [Actinomycetes bacterium]
MSLVTTTTPVWVGNGTGGLGSRVFRLLAASDKVCLAESGSAPVEVLVWLAADNALPDHGVLGGLSAALRESPELRHVVLVSSAMVYGAWENNPVPLTEEALLRPDVEFAFARQLGAAEQLVDAWRREGAGRTATVLRPAIGMAADDTSRLAAALAAGMGQRFGTADPPAQFLHLDDLAAAVLLAVEQQLDGVFNVAPDGWIAGERVRALAGAVPRLKLPDRVSEVITNLRWRFQRGPIPPGLRSYTRSPWLIANDRLKAAGWQPNVTNEQAYVEGTEGKWWTMVSPKRRQEITLVGASVATLTGVLLLVRAVRRARRRRIS